MTFRVKNVEADLLFNMPLFEHHLVIDTRAAQDYSAGHIATAVSLPSPSDEDFSDAANEALLVSFVVGLVEEGLNPENISPIVLYGGEASAEENGRFMQWLAERLISLKSNRPLVVATVAVPTGVAVVEDDGGGHRPVVEFSNRLRDYGEEIWLLSAGYEAFQSRYPFLCGDVQFEDLVPMPHRITASIFMGSRPFKMTLSSDVQWLRKLGIGHVIIDDRQPLASQDGLAVLRCAVPDDEEGDMTACFDAAVLYIGEAMEQGSNVLVQVHGRSRSAAVVIAWLMQSRRLTFDAALAAIESRCWKRIDHSMIFAEQLKARQLPLAIADVPDDLRQQATV